MEITSIFALAFISILILYLIIQIIVLFSIGRYKTKPKTSKEIPWYELKRQYCNPLFSPQDHNEWENEGTFNPAAIKDKDGTIHLFYRAIGSGGISQIGHAVSSDGITFKNRSSYPVYQAPSNLDIASNKSQTYDQIKYSSGGGWAGCEDPKTVIIDKRMYMTYVSFEGWHSIRIALTSISLDDLSKSQWNWQRPILISAPGQANKNWTLFPEKINGKFAILHSISPDILIEYVDDLSTLKLFPISSRPPHDEHRNYFGRKDKWDSSVRGVGAPPIKTDYGWLVLYHSMDDQDPNKYKLGAMILDFNNPTKILYRAPNPILSPELHYENESKAGVIYASGAVIHEKNLLVYYGGGDKYVCVAQTPFKEFIEWLTTYGKV